MAMWRVLAAMSSTRASVHAAFGFCSLVSCRHRRRAAQTVGSGIRSQESSKVHNSLLQREGGFKRKRKSAKLFVVTVSGMCGGSVGGPRVPFFSDSPLRCRVARSTLVLVPSLGLESLAETC